VASVVRIHVTDSGRTRAFNNLLRWRCRFRAVSSITIDPLTRDRWPSPSNRDSFLARAALRLDSWWTGSSRLSPPSERAGLS
jgi:hypothetical protein